MKRLYVVVLLTLVLSLFVGCNSNKPVSLADADFKITGNVANVTGWSDKSMRAMETTAAVKENKDGSTENRTGVALADLFAIVMPDAAATTVTFVASDDYTADVPLADLMKCTDCIVAFQSDGKGFDMVLPGFAGKVNVNAVIEIKVQ